MKWNDTKHNLCVFYSSLKDLCVALQNLREKKLSKIPRHQQQQHCALVSNLKDILYFE